MGICDKIYLNLPAAAALSSETRLNNSRQLGLAGNWPVVTKILKL